MKPWGRFIFIFIAYSIALLHTAVPHHHPEVSNRNAMIHHAGCILSQSSAGFLKMIFSTDLGYGHLENFKKGADTRIVTSLEGIFISMVLVPLIFLLIPIRKYYQWPGFYVDKLQKRLLLFSSNHFRAPPSFA